MEKDGITKTYITTMEHNGALQAFPKAACIRKHTHAEHTQPGKLCALHRLRYTKKEVNILAVILFNMHLSLSSPTFSEVLLVLLKHIFPYPHTPKQEPSENKPHHI